MARNSGGSRGDGRFNKGEERVIITREESLMMADLGNLITGMEG